MTSSTTLRPLLLHGAVDAVAVLAVVLWLLAPPGVSGTQLVGRVCAAVCAMALSQIASIRIRVGAAMVYAGWGEAAVIIVLFLLPAVWAALAVLIGVALAQVAIRLFRVRRTSALVMVYNTAALTVSAALAAVVVTAIEPPFAAPMSPTVVVALVAGALTYTVVGVLLISAIASVSSAGRVVALAVTALRGKLFMVVGNVVVGLIAVAIMNAHLLWLAVLAPSLWLLRESYSYSIVSREERRGWRTYALAARALGAPDEPSVACQAVDGAVQLFGARSAEILVIDVDESRTYRGTSLDDVALVAGPPEERPPGLGTLVHPLTIGGSRVGELRLHFAQPVDLTQRDRLKLSSYGDALAGALRDAATKEQLQALAERSVHDAAHDTLTGVANRASLIEVGDAVLGGLRPDAPVALLLLDINKFSDVNSTLGHVAGDDLLRATAARVGGTAASGESVARVGGDEFAVLLTAFPTPPAGESGRVEAAGSAVLGHTLRRARDLADLLASPVVVAGVPLAVEASIGIVTATAGECDLAELLHRADIAMGQAKGSGAQVSWYDGSVGAGRVGRLELLADLREALAATDQLVLDMQIAVDLRTGAPTCVESLVRWRHPRRGPLEPADFIGAVEESELVAPFTRYVLDRSLGIAAGWAAEGIVVPVSVNLSPRSLLDRGLPNDVGRLLAWHQVPAARLVLEISETVVVPAQPVAIQVLDGLRALGVQLAVDDFGTGYSPLTFLTRVPVHEVKIDRTFVDGMVESPEALAIVRTTVDLARRLNMRVVAEGVECFAQHIALLELGCDAAQGFHYYPPMPPDQALAQLRELARPVAKVIPLRAEEAS